MILAKIKNRLARALTDALCDTSNDCSFSDENTFLDRQQCIEKINQYIQWLEPFHIHSVMILSYPSIEALCLYYALVITNKTCIPVHTSTSSELLQTYLERYQVDLLLVGPQHSSQLEEPFKQHLLQVTNTTFFYYAPQTARHFCFIPGVILFTSGTTGLPKAVHYHYDALFEYLQWCRQEFHLNHHDRVLFTTELSFVAGLRPSFLPVLAGAHTVFVSYRSESKQQSIIHTILENVISVLSLTPALFKLLMRHFTIHSLQYRLKSVRLILLSGEKIDVSLIHQWFTEINQHSLFYNLYGATECLVPFYKKIDAPLPEDQRLHLGRLRAGCDYQLIPAQEGTYQLCISGAISTACFDPDATQDNAIFINNKRFIKTNDFVTIRHQELFFCARSQRLIKRYGQLINLDQIEYILRKHHDNLDAIVFADETNENRIYLIIHGVHYNSQLLGEIKHALKTHLPDYMHPSEYLFAQDFPLTSSGKINYALIKENTLSPKNTHVMAYFQRFFINEAFNPHRKIVALGLESIDYIEMAEAFLTLTGKWLDVTKIDEHTQIATIESCLIDWNQGTSSFYDMVKIHPFQRLFYSKELDAPQTNVTACFFSAFRLKRDIDPQRLEMAIAQTLANHFILSSKLECIDEDFFLVSATLQSNFRLHAPFFFRKNQLEKLKISVYSDRLVSIYLQKQKNQYFLIMVYHHIALDGWSSILVREEIFRRYEGIYKMPDLKRADEIKYLNEANDVWLRNHYQINTLKARMMQIKPEEYNQIGSLFQGTLHKAHSCFSFTREQINHFARTYQLEKCSYSVIFAFLLHQVVALMANVNKLSFHVSLSNRNLPVPHIKELLTNMATGLPIFIDGTDLSTKELGLQIQDNLEFYFKNMSYAGLKAIWGTEEIKENFLSIKAQPYLLCYTYINKILPDEYIQSNYIDWSQSTNDISYGGRGVIFLRVYDMGSEFFITLNSKMKKNAHQIMLEQLDKKISAQAQ